MFPNPVSLHQIALPSCFKHCLHTSAFDSLSALLFENHLSWTSRPFFSGQPFAPSSLCVIKATVTRESVSQFPAGLLSANTKPVDRGCPLQMAILNISSLQFTCLLKISSVYDCRARSLPQGLYLL